MNDCLKAHQHTKTFYCHNICVKQWSFVIVENKFLKGLRVGMYVCMYLCMYVYLYDLVELFVCICMYVCICVCMYECICVCMYVSMYMYIHVYLHINVFPLKLDACLHIARIKSSYITDGQIQVLKYHHLGQSLKDCVAC